MELPDDELRQRLKPIFTELEANLKDPDALLGYGHAIEQVVVLITKARAAQKQLLEAKDARLMETLNLITEQELAEKLAAQRSSLIREAVEAGPKVVEVLKGISENTSKAASTDTDTINRI